MQSAQRCNLRGVCSECKLRVMGRLGRIGGTWMSAEWTVDMRFKMQSGLNKRFIASGNHDCRSAAEV